MKEIAKFFLALCCIAAIAISCVVIFISSQQPSNSVGYKEPNPVVEKSHDYSDFWKKIEAENIADQQAKDSEKNKALGVMLKAAIKKNKIDTARLAAELQMGFNSCSNTNANSIAWKEKGLVDQKNKVIDIPSVPDYIASLEEKEKRIVHVVKFSESDSNIAKEYSWFNDSSRGTNVFPENSIVENARLSQKFIAFDDEEYGAWYYTKNTLYYTGATIGFIAILPLAIVASAGGGGNSGNTYDNRDALERQGFVRTGATEYVKPNAYGLGVGMDQYGAPVKIVPVNSPSSSYSDPLLTIKPDAYGLGVGSDQYGRPVKIVPAN